MALLWSELLSWQSPFLDRDLSSPSYFWRPQDRQYIISKRTEKLSSEYVPWNISQTVIIVRWAFELWAVLKITVVTATAAALHLSGERKNKMENSRRTWGRASLRLKVWSIFHNSNKDRFSSFRWCTHDAYFYSNCYIDKKIVIKWNNDKIMQNPNIFTLGQGINT